MVDKRVEQDASTEGGDPAPAPSARAKGAGPHKMENQLEAKKESKVSTDSPDQVAGREGKGTMAKGLEKLGVGKTLGTGDAKGDRLAGPEGGHPTG